MRVDEEQLTAARADVVVLARPQPQPSPGHLPHEQEAEGVSCLGLGVEEGLERVQAVGIEREEGPAGHIIKQGTPTMGGVFLLACAVVAFLPLARVVRPEWRQPVGNRRPGRGVWRTGTSPPTTWC